MRTLSLICCALLVVYGLHYTVNLSNFAGIVLIIIGSLAFLIISDKGEKRADYDDKHIMNR